MSADQLEAIIVGLTTIKNQRWFTRIEVEAIAAALSAKAAPSEKLPPLPEMARSYQGIGRIETTGYTAAQMHAYARAAIATTQAPQDAKGGA